MEHIAFILIEDEVVTVDAIAALSDGEVVALATASAQDDDGVLVIAERGFDIRGHHFRPRGFVDAVLIDVASGGACVDAAIFGEVGDIMAVEFDIGGGAAEFGVERFA